MGDFPYAYWKGGMLNLHFTSVQRVFWYRLGEACD